MRPPTLLALASCLACTVPNPAFDADTDASPPATTSATSSPTTSSPTTASPTTTSPTTTDPASTTDPTPTTGSVDPNTTTANTTTANTTTANTTTADTTADTTDTGKDTEGPVGCWAQGVDGWPVAGTELKNFADEGASDPFITPDGLRIYYIAQPERRPFVSTRKSRDEPFPNGIQLAVWGNDPQYAAAHPAVVLGESEMLMANNNDVAYSLYQPNQPDKYSKPAAIAGTNTAFAEELITATADGQMLIVSRVDGKPLPPFYPVNSPRFHQFTRADPEPGDPFAGDTDITPQVGSLHLAICPVISPDGLHLFFASTEAMIVNANNADELINIYYTRRDSRDAAFGQVLHLPIANNGNGVTCPSSVTADGCELVYHQFHYQAPGYRMAIATRAP